MRSNRRVATFAVLLALAFALPILTLAQTPDPCDANKDGMVDSAEKERCAGGGATSPSASTFRPCDANKDGRVDEAEQKACQEGVRDRCDFDGNGVVNEEERRKCLSGGAACDFDSNGTVDETETQRCAQVAQEKCDLNHDGKVDEEEQRRCAGQAGGPIPDDCRRALEEVRQRRDAFSSDLKAQWADFTAHQERRYQEFAAGNHTEDEWAAFKQELEKARMVLEERMRAAQAEFEAMVQKLEECAHAAGATAPEGCHASDPADYDRFQAYVEEQARQFEAGSEARIQKFVGHQQSLRDEFAAGNHSEDEWKMFEERLSKERAAFESEMHDAALKHRAYLDRLWQEFKEKQTRDCLGEGQNPKMQAYHEEVRDERFRCELEIHDKFQAFFDTKGMDETNWTEADRETYMNMKAEARALMQECEKRLHDQWTENAHEQFREKNRSERFGSFEFDDDGNGSGQARGKYVSFEYETGSLTLRDYRVQGLQLFERAYAPHDLLGEPGIDGSVLAGRGELKSENSTVEFSLKIHDNPTGGLFIDCDATRARADDGSPEAGDPRSCLLTFPEGATVEKKGGEDAENPDEKEVFRYVVSNGETTAFLLVHGPHFWSGNEVEIVAEGRVFFPAENFVHSEFANRHRDDIKRGVEGGKVLAEVDIVKTDGGAEFEASGYDLGEDGSEAEVEVEAKAGTVAIEYDAESSVGKTVVFNLDVELFTIEDLKGLSTDDFKVVYYDVAADGSQTEVPIVMASDIADVLDPSEADPEWWLVLDANGVQLLVSNGHFSSKRVEIQANEAQDQGGTPGVDALLTLALLGAAAVLLTRRTR